MPGPQSFTGEDCAELHLHGGSAVMAAVVERLTGLGLRSAEPGEFTRRAFEHGRMDLAQAEAIADLVDAETAGQRRQALAQFDGALSRRYEVWTAALLDVLALFEAAIDFPDEDVPETVSADAYAKLRRLLVEIEAAVADTQGERIREGFRIALIGAPNVGKSSLLNALAGREAAIVTDVPGTTRDVVEVPLVLASQLVVLADTAGLRQTSDIVEVEGVRRARLWAAQADLRIAVVDASRPGTWDAVRADLQPGDVVALNKSDLAASGALSDMDWAGVLVSSQATVQGVATLQDVLADAVSARSSGSFPAATRARHRGLLQEAETHLGRALEGASVHAELVGEDLRLALRSLERITGRSDPEAVLDRVFASFCIGK